MSKQRVPIPKEIAANVLFDADRTCCVCRKEKLRIQIHHIDDNPANNDPQNLAVLCFDCHWETQIRGGFDRKLDAEQIQLYKNDWLSQVKLNRKQGVRSPPLPKTNNKDYIEYEVVQDSIVSYSNSEVLKKSGFFTLFAIMILFGLLAIVGSGLYFQNLTLMFLAPLIIFIGGFYLNKYRLFIKILFFPQNDEIDRYIDGMYVHKGSDGNYTLYEKVAMCIFPRCKGEVRIYNAPPRERYKYAVIGRCNLDSNLHTYTVDFNGTGYIKEMDLRPLPQQIK